MNLFTGLVSEIVVDVGAVDAAAQRLVGASLAAVAVTRPPDSGDAVTDPALAELTAAMRLALDAAHEALVTTCQAAVAGVAVMVGVDRRAVAPGRAAP